MQNFSKPYVDVPIRFWASIVQTLPRYEQKSDFSNFSGSHNSNTKNRKKFFLMQNVLKPFIDVPIRFWASIVQTLPRYEQKSDFSKFCVSHNLNTKNKKKFFLMQNFSKPYVDVPIRFWASIVQTLPRYEQKSAFFRVLNEKIQILF